jgi:hypothetical protein
MCLSILVLLSYQTCNFFLLLYHSWLFIVVFLIFTFFLGLDGFFLSPFILCVFTGSQAAVGLLS